MKQESDMAEGLNLENATRGLPGYRSPSYRKCVNCQKVMLPRVEWRPAEAGEKGYRSGGRVRVAVSVLHYGYGPESLFCTLSCGYQWACKHASF
jgi:hypothetical protein